MVELAAAPTVAIDDGFAIALEATDIDRAEYGSWHIHGLSKGIAWHRGGSGEPAQTRLSGTATQLFLALVRRYIVDDAQFQGDEEVWRTWLAGTPL